ncbi:MAG: Smr/MutS family protein [Candidatus Omnitrophica bacterium]|nr:Smr/MutS family protein [Candidatus Omnitrophota bacterium]MDD5488034.1 Smr/MutS family protein [Candidatus Omnitrophota bacterium]
MKKIVLDLHDIFNKGNEIERALEGALEEAGRIHARMLEIIPGKGTGQLKKRVLKFLERNKSLFDRVEKPPDNWGKIIVRFKT